MKTRIYEGREVGLVHKTSHEISIIELRPFNQIEIQRERVKVLTQDLQRNPNLKAQEHHRAKALQAELDEIHNHPELFDPWTNILYTIRKGHKVPQALIAMHKPKPQQIRKEKLQ